MKNLLLIASFFLKTHSDTIDNWQVYQNRKLLAAYSANDQSRIVIIKKSHVKFNDTFTISYFRDTPCSECKTQLSITDGYNKPISILNTKGTFTPFKFSLTDLLKNADNNTYLFYRAEDTREHRRLLFKLVIK